MYQALVFLTVLASAAMAAVPLYGQCGGSGWTGETTCTIGICSIQNEWYSQCVLGQTTNPPASTVSSTSTAASPVGTTLPSSFTWSSTGVLISPKVDSRNLSAWKDPSVVFHDGKYHVFASTAHDAGYNLVYLSFTDFDEAESAPFYYLDETPIGSGYRAAPQVFFMAPQNKWYLIFQNGNAAYSTNSDISNPNGWTPPQNFYAGTPNTITNNIGSGFWVDMWVICDSSNCHLFSSDDNGHLYRSQTSISNFPAGMSEPVIALQDSNSHNLFEQGWRGVPPYR